LSQNSTVRLEPGLPGRYWPKQRIGGLVIGRTTTVRLAYVPIEVRVRGTRARSDSVRAVARYELRQEAGCEFLAWPEVSDRTTASTVVVNGRADLVALQEAGHVVMLDEVTQSLFDDCFPTSADT
jgi:hypothetical protein